MRFLAELISYPGGITDLANENHWSGQTLEAESEHRIEYLEANGFRPGQLFLITHGGTPELFADLFAVWGIGGTAACLNPKLTINELETIAEFTDAAAILLAPGVEKIPLSSRAPQLDLAAATETARETTIRTETHVSPDDPALILFTSGTTGAPKGVVHTFGSIHQRLRHNWQRLDNKALARTLCVLPTHFGHGLIGNCLTPLFAGQALYLLQDQGIAGAARIGALIDEHRISFLSSVPSFWKIALPMSPPPRRGSLRQVSVGSAPLAGDLWQSIIDWAGTPNVVNMYGITETANWVAGASAREFRPESGLVGRMWGGDAAVLCPDGSVCSEGHGELLLKPPSLMQGYLKRADLTSQAIEDGWYHTGDIGSIDGDGILRLLGREKTEINRAGMKVLPEEIDQLLEGHPDVEEACAFGVPDQISGEIVGVAYVLNRGSEVPVKALRDWCGERIRPDCVPDRWFAVAEIPKTDRGKVNRQNVLAHCLHQE